MIVRFDWLSLHRNAIMRLHNMLELKEWEILYIHLDYQQQRSIGKCQWVGKAK